MVVRELIALLGFKFDESKVKRADSQLNKLKQSAQLLGAVFAGGIVARGVQQFLSENLKMADQLDKTSEKLGFNVEKLQEYHHAANLSGVNTRTFDMALQRFSRRAAEAAKGTGEAKAALAEMGIRLRDGKGALRDTDALLLDVSNSLSRTANSGDRTRLAFKLFDSEGVSVVNMLKDGSGALMDMRNEARAMGSVMSAEMIKKAVEVHDQMARLTAALQGFKNLILADAIPALSSMVKGMISFVMKAREFIRGTDILKFGLVGLAAAFVALGGSMLLPLLTAALVVAKFLVLASIIALVSEEFYAFLTGGDSLLGMIIDNWDKFLEKFMQLETGNGALDKFVIKPLQFMLCLLNQIGKAIAAVAQAFTGDFTGVKSVMDEIAAAGQTALDYWNRKIGKALSAPLMDTMIAPDEVDRRMAAQSARAVPSAVGASASSTTNATRVEVKEVNVTVPPGSDGREIGRAAADALQMELSNMNALIPVPAGG